ncbi:hypothetical protein [Polyangium mundeleinium]|uniref:Uncharacterized protein n=1 Tax=Polyangium mundeleinium TaxID=2995306 RepID=A0ABT5F4E1_9BACT|nr:hypothetical protein [Polyangium mundeleinium]MDC0748494.1 hypothetical protein [Polyangium mundeleinium]
MTGTNGKSNGKANGHVIPSATTQGTSERSNAPITPPPPRAVQDLADSCVRFVERAIGFKLDFEPETLPVLDHYIEKAREDTRDRKEARPLLAQAIGAYLGEIARRKFQGFWRLEDEHDPRSWRVELEPVYLILRPIELATRALDLPPTPPRDASPIQGRKDEDADEDDDENEGTEAAAESEATPDEVVIPDPMDDLGPALLELDEDDQAAVAERLALLPPVSDAEYHAPSTHLEVVEIIVETIRARRMAAGMEADAHLEPDDYS